MTMSKSLRTAVAGATIAAITTATLTPAQADPRGRRGDEVGAAVAIGVGALVLGGILASKSRGGHHREVYREPPPRRHSYPAPHVNRAPKQPYLNDGH